MFHVDTEVSCNFSSMRESPAISEVSCDTLSAQKSPLAVCHQHCRSRSLLRFAIDPEVSCNVWLSIWKSPAISCRSGSLLQFLVATSRRLIDLEVSCNISSSIRKSPTIHHHDMRSSHQSGSLLRCVHVCVIDVEVSHDFMQLQHHVVALAKGFSPRPHLSTSSCLH